MVDLVIIYLFTATIAGVASAARQDLTTGLIDFNEVAAVAVFWPLAFALMVYRGVLKIWRSDV